MSVDIATHPGEWPPHIFWQELSKPYERCCALTQIESELNGYLEHRAVAHSRPQWLIAPN